MEKNILEINNLSIAFEKKELFSKKETLYAVENIDLNIKEKEIVALVGESACGKSLTALSILKLLPETASVKSGIIKFDSKDIYSLSRQEFQKLSGNELSIIFQNPMSCLNPLKRVGKQIEEAAIAHGKTKEEARKMALEILSITGFYDVEDIYKSYPSELSGGMMQRVLIAMALINGPKLLIADEPTTALDVTIEAQITDLILKLNKTLKTSILLISHSLTLVSNICHRIYVMYAGKIIESGTTSEIITNPLHPYTKALIQTLPDLNIRSKKLNVISGTVPTLKERQNFKCPFYDRCDFRKEKNISSKCKNKIPDKTFVSETHFVKCCFYKGGQNGTD
ncbi:MAG: ABC transporter ATP-binding protein [Treponema sp.]|uniref:ABC transporter ATP-binding protein n=1 Tax=Treponema sp. TaxID=166 RepID=UPI001B5DBB22|nr:ABC transporter ATP-binding protein [Treponema sp.]MBP5402847.1 ABC transporter ATP-binding protein [Treponema sp.]MBR5933641.1 ABC transporter ATP-binding protein [Treponema sp.]